MSTPASQVLSGANSGGNSSGGAAGAVAGGTTNGSPATGSPGGAGGAQPNAGAANQGQFWNTWTAPEQKETRDWVANKNYADPFTLAKTAQGLEREAATLRAAKGYPTDVVNPDGSVTKADENARKAWNMAVGVPETPDKYNLPSDKSFPQFTQFMSEEMHKAGVPSAMATQLVKAYDEANAKTLAAMKAQEDTASQTALAELEHAWGPQYQERVALAARGKEWLSKEVGGLNDTQLRTMESVLGTAKFMAAMWKFGAGNKEASFAGGDGQGGFAGGASEAQARMDQIMADRTLGKISDFQWRTSYEKEVLGLRDRIVAGMATQQ